MKCFKLFKVVSQLYPTALSAVKVRMSDLAATEMAKHLRSFVTLTDNSGTVHSTHMMAHNLLYIQF